MRAFELRGRLHYREIIAEVKRASRRSEGSHTGERTVYHGTDQQFAAFDDAKRGTSTGHPTALLGHFVTIDPRHAASYPAYSSDKRVVALLLRKGRYYAMPINRYYEHFPRASSAQSVRDFRADLEAKGYDGIRLTRPDADFPLALLRSPHTEVGTFIVFNPAHLRPA